MLKGAVRRLRPRDKLDFDVTTIDIVATKDLSAYFTGSVSFEASDVKDWDFPGFGSARLVGDGDLESTLFDFVRCRQATEG